MIAKSNGAGFPKLRVLNSMADKFKTEERDRSFANARSNDKGHVDLMMIVISIVLMAVVMVVVVTPVQ